MKLSDTNSFIYLLKGGCFCQFCDGICKLAVTPSVSREITNFFNNNKGKLLLMLKKIAEDYDLNVDISSFSQEYQEFSNPKRIILLNEAPDHPSSSINYFKSMNECSKAKGDISILAHVLWNSTPVKIVVTSDHPLIKIISACKFQVYTLFELILELEGEKILSPKQLRFLFDESLGHYNIPLKAFKEKFGIEYFPRFQELKRKIDSIECSGGVILPI